MQIYFERENMHRKLKFSGTVSQLLQKLKLNPATVLVVRNRALVTESDKLKDADEVKILSVISGG